MKDENNLIDQMNSKMDMMAMVSNVVAAYVSNHTVEPSELPSLMQQVRRSLCGSSTKASFVLAAPGTPAVPIEDSVTPDYIICLEDGKRMKMLKRHLKTAYGMTTDQYRERWNLPASYPMVAPNYAKKRQDIANSIGLGTHRKKKAA